ELAHHVVEQQQRRSAALLRELLPLGEQQREQGEALLAARPVGAQLAAIAQERQLVAVGAVAGEPALEVGVDALRELGGQRGRALAGHSAAISWSRCARRSAGAPTTSSRRSGRKTEASGRAGESVSRSTSAPSTCRRFGWPGLKPTAMRWRSPASSNPSSSR